MTIAYEPVWAIGTGLVCDAPIAQEVHKFIRYDPLPSEALRLSAWVDERRRGVQQLAAASAAWCRRRVARRLLSLVLSALGATARCPAGEGGGRRGYCTWHVRWKGSRPGPGVGGGAQGG